MGLFLSIFGAFGVGGVIGVFVTQIMTNRREAANRRVAFKKQQLEQFYGPLLAAHKELRARSELRVKLQTALDDAHTEDMLRTGRERLEAASDPHISAITTNVQDENQTFREVLMPRYRQMIDTFRDKMWLAERETRPFFQQLIEFVDVWDKILADKLPRSAAVTINHTEKNLTPFYEHLEKIHDRLQSEVS
ncbi:hypothetical protein EI171_08475 [Bradyrhizobium sp. LCT2]|uniref:hypothetical protein n=1 Tax=Bradyrhizobium sp. LCT2 TaxID=2493093 RepID=UPI00137394EE|nr:hypothetical protein [Bradyrhizobium sp. LCT2]QHP67457.1 hypothetical protein EI171_08475 [Bradyrhizobium sp. LCT2]